MSGVSTKALSFGVPGNKEGFNGNESQNKEFSDGSGLEVYDFNARTYDQQIGRFFQIDPLGEDRGQESLSPFQFAWNNPVKLADADGKFPFLIPLIPIIADGLVAASTAVVSYVAAKTITDQLQNVNSNSKEPGSYTTTHESGKKYHGKGPEPRSEQSAKEKAKEYDDPVIDIDWKPSKDNKEAFKDEAKRIRNDGGVENPNNYNKRNSPGEKELKKEDAKNANTNTSTASNSGLSKVADVSTPIIITIAKIIDFFK